MREDVLLALVARVGAQSDQVDASYWGEVALDQVGVAGVLRYPACAGLGDQALLAPLPGDRALFALIALLLQDPRN